MRGPPILPDDLSLRDLLLWVERRRIAARRRLTARRVAPVARPAASEPRPAAAAPTGAAPGTVLTLDAPTPDLRRFTVAKPSGFSYAPGQSVRLELEGTRRRYTMVSAPHEPALEFLVELVPGGRMSARLRGLRPGAAIGIAGDPKGGIALDTGAKRHLMLATVTGVNPFVSILRDAVRRGRTDLRVVLVHGASYADEFGYNEELSALAAAHPGLLTYIPTVSRPDEPRNAGWRGARGRADALIEAVIARHSLAPADTTAYACGNTGMVETAAARLGGLGYRVRTETYD
ncbi:FAD-binding oxidoreductase [Caenispirillum bisanense]|uniref:Ferredoxin--NADP+ reductase n=1 Tax=Caenispirillum bisanense TaxID=414052 RepID=A0A286GRI5_9PROT|nr:FAD-binding oxidoreductase [Caenispirillum bisanense]SOD98138.1 ferredoxin--NADP+ reductase [Caenispirillum bisanense]